MKKWYAVSAAALIATATKCLAKGDQANIARDVAIRQASDARIEQAVRTRWNDEAGFSIAPMKLYDGVSSEDSAATKELDQNYPTIWKSVNQKFADAYAKRQEPVNNKQFNEAAALRELINDALTATCKLRGGGSETQTLMTFTKAETEWILSQLRNGKADSVDQQQFASQLRSSVFYVNGQPSDKQQAEQFSRCLALFSKADSSLTPDQKSVLRKEVLNYFED